MNDVVGMVLCAGLGTRLRPLTDRLPKPAAPVCGLPLVQYAFALLAGAGARRAVVNTHHRPEEMARAAREAAAALGLELAVSHEARIAGTGGALREAAPALRGASEILVVNGDVLFDVDLGAALAAHRASGALATMVLMEMPAGARYNAVEVDRGGAVRRIAGRSGPGGEGLRPWHFTGVHVLSGGLVDRIAAAPFEADVNHDVYPALMREGLVRAHFAAGYWNDLGTPARYLEANLAVLAGRVPLNRFRGADPFAGAEPFGEPGLWVAPGAHLAEDVAMHAPLLIEAGAVIDAGASLGPGAVVGADARIGPGAIVRDAVVWGGTRIGPGEEVVRAVAAGELRVLAA